MFDYFHDRICLFRSSTSSENEYHNKSNKIENEIDIKYLAQCSAHADLHLLMYQLY